MWFFRGCSPSRNYDTTPRHTWLIFCTLHTTLDSTVQWSCIKLDHWFYFNLPGEFWSKTARQTGPLQTSTNPQPMWIVDGGLQYATAIVTSPKQAPHRVGQSSAKKELTDSDRSEEKCRKREEKPKVLQVAGRLEPRQTAIACCAREKAASKSHLLGRWKMQSALGDPTFLLPSISCRFMRSSVFIFLKFLNWKMWR